MIIVMKNYATEKQIQEVESKLIELGFKTHPIYGEIKTVIGAVGDKRLIDTRALIDMAGVDSVIPIMKPYKLASREYKQEDSIVDIGGVGVGGNEVIVFAGPCAVENKEYFFETARYVKNAGAKILRGGAFKPRTSPYAFQGLQEDGLKMLAEAREMTGMKIVTEVMDPRDVELVSEYADIIQIGARNMQNFRLLQEIGASMKPVLLKRGIASTIEEWLMAAEYIMLEGNPKVILCERGIRTYETSTRNTLDISAIPVVKEVSHLPVIVDPSHASGTWKYVSPMAKAAVAAGADGLIVEVHANPEKALCDGPQSLKPDTFGQLMNDLKIIANAVGRSI
ncbi:MAG: 3-deoxy-7-phosphoheptulonate synthase [Deltaproteobacteria bacterium]